MKKLLAGIIAISMVVAILITTGCGKDDLTAPTITLVGDNPLMIYLNADWATEDPGATANDVEDGDLTSAITVTNTPDVTTAGEYEVVYSVTDKAGNAASTTRKVYVNHNPSTLAGIYNVVDSIIGGGVYSYTDNITASAIENRIIASKFANYTNGLVHFDLYGENVVIPQQTVNCGNPAASRVFEGTGTIENSGLKITLNYTEVTGGTTVSGVEIYTKQ